MRLVHRLVLTFVVISIIGAILAGNWINNEVRRTYSDLIEETLISKSKYIAASLEDKDLDRETLTEIDNIVRKYKLNSSQYTRNSKGAVLDHNVFELYITNKSGVVLYHSLRSSEVGEDYSKWNDVYLTLKKEYGARSTRTNPDDPLSSVFYIAAPIYKNGNLNGVVSVFIEELSLNHILAKSKSKVMNTAFYFIAAIFLIIMVTFNWITKPFDLLKGYVSSIANKRSVELPILPKGEFQEIGMAIKDMKDTIDEKNKIENHVQHLIHELKSPLTTIVASSEIVSDELKDLNSNVEVQKFSSGIQFESSRIKNMLNSLLKVSQLEKMPHLDNRVKVDLRNIIDSVLNDLKPTLIKRGDTIQLEGEGSVLGDYDLLYQSVRNIIQNICDHAKAPATISIQMSLLDGNVQIVFKNTGVDLPEYASEKLFEKFFSMPNIHSGQKSSGLGLSFVKEVSELHNGHANVDFGDNCFHMTLIFPANSNS